MRLPPGVPGFDALVGGIPAGTAVVIQGPAGREKNAFLFQFVVEGLTKGGAALVLRSSAPVEASYPGLATSYESNGDLWVAYERDVQGTTRAIYARSLDYGSGGWQSATTVDAQSGTILTRSSIGIDKDNNLHALYVATNRHQTRPGGPP